MLNVKKLLTKMLNASVRTVVTPLITLTGESWGDHYYQDVNVTSYIPSGAKVVGAFASAGTAGSVLNISIQDSANNVIRVINDTPMANRQVSLFLLYRGGGYCLAVFSRLSAVLGRFSRWEVA